MQDLAELHGSVANGPNNEFTMTLSLRDVSYSPLRQLLWNSYWDIPVGAAIQCHAGGTLYLYNLIPFRLGMDVEASVLSPSMGVTNIYYASSGITSSTGLDDFLRFHTGRRSWKCFESGCFCFVRL
jgi:hypothetical protein